MTSPRFGVIGTGPWAELVHVPAAASSERASFTAVLGRDRTRLSSLLNGTTAHPYTDMDSFLDAVDIVGFAVPPAVQARLASNAIAAGKHLLLEKPLSLDARSAAELASAATSRGVCAIVFFPHLLDSSTAAWAAEQHDVGGWVAGRAESWSSVLVDNTNHFHDSPWRHERGALWDTGPHLVAQLCAVLGNVTSVTAKRGTGDLVTSVLVHEGGAHSSIAMAADLPAPPPPGSGTYFVGAHGKVTQPAVGDWIPAARDAYATAITNLVDQVELGTKAHPSNILFGAHVTAVLAAIERSATSGRVEPIS